MRTYLEAKVMAKSLRTALAAKGISLSHSECLELVSKQIGFDEWNMLSAKIALETGERSQPSPASPSVSLQPPVPVLKIASAAEAKRFYIDFLGFECDWGWPENDDKRPLYAQISRSDVSLHLSTHGADRGTTELLIRMTGLDAFHAELSRKTHECPLALRQTPDDRREIQVTDALGNRLRFSENNPPGVSQE
jgi:hypothetical protein